MHRYRRVTRMEDFKEFELDIKKTLMVNIFYSLLLMFIGFYMFFTLKFLTTITDPNTQVIALIVYMFSLIKLLGWVGYPDLQFKYIKDTTNEKT